MAWLKHQRTVGHPREDKGLSKRSPGRNHPILPTVIVSPVALPVKPAPLGPTGAPFLYTPESGRQKIRIKWLEKNRKMRFTAILPHSRNCSGLVEMTLPKIEKKGLKRPKSAHYFQKSQKGTNQAKMAALKAGWTLGGKKLSGSGITGAWEHA
jgi:hypothetical protein